MKKLALLFSHKLSEDQKSDAEKSLGIKEFIYMSDRLLKKWSDIPEDIDIYDYSKDFKSFIEENCTKDDYILIEGEYGITYHMVDWCKSKGYNPIYSFSKRVFESKEVENGVFENIHYFKHIKYKNYID